MINKDKFPNNFLWGTATSSYQIEGAMDADGKGKSVWDTYSHTSGKIQNNDNGDVACDHYNLWPKDIKLLKKLGVKAYRLSISWPRIFPSGHEKAPNLPGLDFYSQLIDNLLENNIKPFITLNHWDIPQGLEDIGGWPSRDMVDAFVKYSYYVSDNLGDRVKNWITHNEPWCISYLGYVHGQFPPGLKDNWPKSLATAHHLLLSHGMSINEIRNNSKDSEIGITLNLSPSTPASKSTYDAEACKFYDAQFNRLYLDPLYKKSYPEDLFDSLIEKGLIRRSDINFIKQGDLESISQKTDFLGVNFYSRAVIRNNDITEDKNLPIEVTLQEKTDFGWEIHPRSLYDLLMRIKKDYPIEKIYITENGCAYNDAPDKNNIINDSKRIEYHSSHINELKNAIKDGVPCKGYFAWSLMDNFEWCEGFGKRFGLIWVDFESLERIPKQSFFWYKNLIENNGKET